MVGAPLDPDDIAARILDARTRIACSGLAACRSIRAATGLPLRRWLLETRLRAAADELRDGAAVAAAAARHGWRDPFLFSRQFRALFGMPPTRWRARW